VPSALAELVAVVRDRTDELHAIVRAEVDTVSSSTGRPL
jgi:hypothetical protein